PRRHVAAALRPQDAGAVLPAHRPAPHPLPARRPAPAELAPCRVHAQRGARHRGPPGAPGPDAEGRREWHPGRPGPVARAAGGNSGPGPGRVPDALLRTVRNGGTAGPLAAGDREGPHGLIAKFAHSPGYSLMRSPARPTAQVLILFV